jgi:hypothetical protein
VALQDLDGISNVAYTQTLAWETAADWDNAVDSSETVVHENFGDFTDAEIALGYPSGVLDNLQVYWHLMEDAGSTAGDAGPNDATGTINGAAVGEPGILGTTCYRFDGSDDWVDFGDPAALSAGTLGDSFSFFMWMNMETSTGDWLSHASTSDNDNWRWWSNGREKTWYLDGVRSLEDSGGVVTGSWTSYAGTYDGSTVRLYENGTELISGSASGQLVSSSAPWAIGSRGGDGSFADGRIGPTLIFTDALSASEVSMLHNIQSGRLTTATKSYAGPQTPDLRNLSYSLNGGSIDLDVIGSPDAAGREVVTQPLDGSSAYDLAWNSSHVDFRLRPTLSVPALTDTSPVFGGGEVVG